jgi:capsular polysaccharide biosynthesis protein
VRTRIGINQLETEPTVFGAARRYWYIVAGITLLSALAFVAHYTWWTPPAYRASARVTVPQELALKEQLYNQYIDREMLLLRSPAVAEQAATITNRELGRKVVDSTDFSDVDGSLEFKPPDGYNPGQYGANIIGVAFRWQDPRVAQIAANAVLQAFDLARSSSIRANAEASIAAIDQAMAVGEAHDGNLDQRGNLLGQRAATLVNQQIDLAQHPTFEWADAPQTPIGMAARDAAMLGVLIGAILGTVVAYVLANVRRRFDNRYTPAALYDAPLIGRIPAFNHAPMIGKIH